MFHIKLQSMAIVTDFIGTADGQISVLAFFGGVNSVFFRANVCPIFIVLPIVFTASDTPFQQSVCKS